MLLDDQDIQNTRIMDKWVVLTIFLSDVNHRPGILVFFFSKADTIGTSISASLKSLERLATR